MTTVFRNDWKVPVIGITGSIGSGKSTAARIFADLGGEVIDADMLLRQVTRKGTRAYRRIVRHFGRKVLRPDGRIDRAALGKIVFADSKERAALEEMTHAEIMKAAGRRTARIACKEFVPVFLEAALLVESGLHKSLDRLVVVVCDEGVLAERLGTSRKLSGGDIRMRMESQMPAAEKAKAADWIIDNSGSLERLRARIREVFEKIMKSPAYVEKKKRWRRSP